ncbi:hypothetical protein EBR43_05320 [bacterium]|nr:hypothetical protein [bacterium]
MTFKDYFHNKIKPKDKPLETKKRHMHPTLRDVNSHSKHPGRVVPHMHRTIKANQKVESLKKKTTGRYICNNNDIKEIETEFNLNFDREKPKSLGNTGIILRYDPVLSAVVVEK